MKPLPTSPHWLTKALPILGLLLAILLAPSNLSAQSFKKGCRKYKKEKVGRAERIFKKYRKHEVYDLGAEYYLTLIKYKTSKVLGDWAKSDSILAALEKRYKLAGPEKFTPCRPSLPSSL
ncbi:MAG: hypothetical protein ACKVUS_22320 [Saprospiraceae bacterium]